MAVVEVEIRVEWEADNGINVALQSNNNHSGFSRQRKTFTLLSASHSTRISIPTTAISNPFYGCIQKQYSIRSKNIGQSNARAHWALSERLRFWMHPIYDDLATLHLPTSHSQRLKSGKFLGTSRCEWLWSVVKGSAHLDTVQLETINYSDRYLEAFHCSSAVSGSSNRFVSKRRPSIATWVNGTLPS